MYPDRHSPSDDSDPEEENFEEEDGDEQVAAEAETEVNSDEDEEEEVQPETDDEAEEEEEDLEKTGLDYGSVADSGETMPSPSPDDFVVKENLEGRKKRAAESEAVNEKSEMKKSKKEKKKGEKESVVVAAAPVVEDNVAVEDKAKRSSGQRIWGPEDELMIVKGMLDYKEKTGVDFNSNLDAFYQFVKGQLNAVVDKTQLVNKIRKLKEKFRDNAAKEGNGGELVFVKTHEAEVYEYLKKVWGGKAVARSKSKSKKEQEVDVPRHVMEVDNVLALPVPDPELSKKEVNGDGVRSVSRVQKSVKKPKVVHKMEFAEAGIEMKDSVIPMPPMVDGMWFQKGLELVEKSKVDDLNEKWTEYQVDAAELYLRRVDLIKEQTELVLDALKSHK